MPSTLVDLRETLSHWKGIELARTSNLVMGEGSERARVMFIGEAPGEKEDAAGRPFVGQAGKLLDQLLASIDLKRDDVYITNLVKFRPPENRDPTPEEKAACLPFLQTEIAIIKPRVLVPLGRHALTQFFPTITITDAHGKPFPLSESAQAALQPDTDAITVFPLYHPAAALHNPRLRSTLFADCKALGEFLKSF